MKRIHIFIQGRVQGVAFRSSIRRRAKNSGITGFVRNVEGKVEVVAEGEDSAIEELVEFCHKGPMLAKVTDVDVSEEEVTNEFDSFEVRF